MEYYALLASRKISTEAMKKFFIIALLLCNFSAYAFQDQDVYLPDGTKIIIKKNKAYYSCKGKTIFLPDGRYLLADGVRLSIKRERIVELNN
jgi:hypothetical protein